MTRIHDKLKQHRYIFSNLEKEFHSENTWDREDNLGDELRIYQQHIYKQAILRYLSGEPTFG